MQSLIQKIKRKMHLYARLLRRPFRDALLRKKIHGERVVILGSGPSARDLDHIPADVLIFACNCSPEALLQKETLPKRVDLYIGNRKPFETYAGRIEPILNAIDIDIFATRSLSYIKGRTDIQTYNRLIFDETTQKGARRLLQQIIAPKTPGDIYGDTNPKTLFSTGVCLMQYALYYGATEVYFIGMDLDTRGHAFAEKDTTQYGVKHQTIDHTLLETVKEKYPDRIFSASPNSPITDLIPYKPLE